MATDQTNEQDQPKRRGYECKWDGSWVNGNVKIQNVHEHRAEEKQPHGNVAVYEQV